MEVDNKSSDPFVKWQSTSSGSAFSGKASFGASRGGNSVEFEAVASTGAIGQARE